MSGLFGTKDRIPKNSPVYEALGSVDELNSLLGVCRAHSAEQMTGMEGKIGRAQECLFIIQAELAGAGKTITKNHIEELEHIIGTLEEKFENPHAFVIPGATTLSALCDYARAVARRAERNVVTAHSTHNVSDETKAYLNRLSSFLYALARHSAVHYGEKEASPSY